MSVRLPYPQTNVQTQQLKPSGQVAVQKHTGFAFNCLDRDELENQDKIDLYGIENQVESQNG
ncbi:unnamed protein product (macronuclear) [Paramecium tetraurelia]|uniref:Uncharacterized protein n=1 Tax=Paramecium tetraurelia TaxID=5888 RepID=A0CTH0_PARTE|nr:uncharacterized protein GSPATT00010321001 [Paramecium tetraurelia]CAK74087.1 unnamed protein product [Paramecium tetraurelia]|eukprot:XP_001441484.1 hypothetical protein (macronuclear) [Paramecium tetraurelia strain d4-2]